MAKDPAPFDEVRQRGAELLIHIHRKIGASHPLVNFIPIIPILVLVSTNLEIPSWIPGAMFLPIALVPWHYLFRRTATIGFFIHPRTRRKWKLISLASPFGLSICGILSLVSANQLYSAQNIPALFMIMFGIGLAFRPPGPNLAVRYRDGWFRISGIPRLTLLRLKRIAEAESQYQSRLPDEI